jgi:citrate synthase
MSRWLSASDVTERLGITRPTLYAYVSRGLVRSSAIPGQPRERRYAAEDVERLRTKSEQRRDPTRAVANALHWGGPVLESAITLISGGRIYYRGHDVVELAKTRSVEEVASLVWTGVFDTPAFATTQLHVVAGGKSIEALPFVNRAQSILPLVAARDRLAYDLRPRAVAQTGWRIINLLVSVAADSADLAGSIEETLQQKWAPRDRAARDLIRAALILCADHELNVSSFVARCAASAGSNPYAVVLAGLAAIEGVKHGGVSARVETMLDELRRAPDLHAALADRLKRGEQIYGFGHPLYPDGDPRAQFLFELLQERYGRSAELAFALQLSAIAEDLLGDKPTVDFALAALTRALKLGAGVPLALFALGRTIGWVGHAIEQYGRNEIIRPRARYVGPEPVDSREVGT